MHQNQHKLDKKIGFSLPLIPEQSSTLRLPIEITKTPTNCGNLSRCFRRNCWHRKTMYSTYWSIDGFLQTAISCTSCECILQRFHEFFHIFRMDMLEFIFFISFIPRTLNPCAMLCKYISDVCPVLRSAPLGEIFILYWSKMWPTGDKVLASGHNSPPSWSTYDS